VEVGDEADDLLRALPGGIGDTVVVQIEPGRGRLGRRRRRRRGRRRRRAAETQELDQSLKDAFVRHSLVSTDQKAIHEASWLKSDANPIGSREARSGRHCEERSDEAIQRVSEAVPDGFASLAMTT
jgi:hypothetical protein